LRIPILGIPTFDYLVASQPCKHTLGSRAPAGRRRWLSDGIVMKKPLAFKRRTGDHDREDLSSLITNHHHLCGEFDARTPDPWPNGRMPCLPHGTMRAHPVCWPNWAGPALKPVNRTNHIAGSHLPAYCEAIRLTTIRECKIFHPQDGNSRYRPGV